MMKDRIARSQTHDHVEADFSPRGQATRQDDEFVARRPDVSRRTLSEAEKIRQSFLLRPGDQLDTSQLSIFPEEFDFEFEGYRLLGLSWEGAAVNLTPDNRVECISLGKAPRGFDGLVLNMPSSDALSIHPDLSVVAPDYDEPPLEGLVFYRADRTDENYELLLTTRNDRVTRIAVASLGYWFDPERKTRNERQAAKFEAEKLEARKLWEKRTKEAELRDRWKSVSDTDAMLDIWCETAPVAKKELARRLLSSPPSEWSDIGERFNFSDGLAPLFWIVRQPQTDVETLFDLFVLCEPEYYCDPKNQQHREEYDTLALIEEIRLRVEADNFRVIEDFDGAYAWEHALLGANRSADFFAPYRTAFCRIFAASA